MELVLKILLKSTSRSGLGRFLRLEWGGGEEVPEKNFNENLVILTLQYH